MCWGGGHSNGKRGIRLVHGHTKSTLITYFSGMKIDPKYTFLHAFFLICPSCPFQNFSIWPKNTFFPNFAHFCTPKRCMCIQCLVLKNNPNYVNFWTSVIPPTFEWPPWVCAISIQTNGTNVSGIWNCCWIQHFKSDWDPLCSHQLATWTHPPQRSSQIWCHLNVKSWGI